ncbi:hypothetical protein J8J42_10820 [Chryseobacterium sp. cx-311]|uniref:hypothetical protein n=1 Tax=Marnyiella aurantia TaxID=2758037 RepID=UPI001AE7C5EE|nr:hypothetical protein [Marnyiella aurantia]MBP0613539.1 hypothetical protein [Marnyiella aurantia]
MKKSILLAMLIGGVFAVTAQTQTKLNVILNPIQSITVNDASKEVTLEYVTTDNYLTGVSSPVLNNHLTVYSTGGFQVKAKAANLTNGLTTAPGQNVEILSSGISLLIAKGTGNNGSDINPSTVNLGTGDVNLFSSTTGGTSMGYNVTYKGAGNNEYVGKHFSGTGKTTYTTNVMYSIVAQ